MDDAFCRKRMVELKKLLDMKSTLAQTLVKDFFVKDCWGTVVQESWLPHLDTLSLDELAAICESPVPPQSRTGVWPLSLLAFLQAVHALRLPGQLDARGVAADAASDGASVTSVGRCREEGSVASALWDSVKPKKMHQ